MKNIPLTKLLAALLLLASVSLTSAATVTARYFRFTQTKLRTVSANSIQLSEFDLLFQGARVAGATATNPGGSSPAGEVVAYVVDGNTGTKWLDFNKMPLVLDFGAPVATDGYRFATAGDATERDPVSWVLESSDDNATWNFIEVRDDYPTTTVRNTYIPDILFEAPVPLQIVSFNPTRPKIGAGESSALEWRVVGSTSVSIAPSVGSVGETGTANISPAVDTTYTLTANKGAEIVSQQVTVKVIIAGEHTFRYFRFTPTRLREATATSIQLAEFEMLDNTGAAITGATATAPGSNSPVGEGVSNLVDGAVTNKWLNFNKGLFVLDYGADVTVKGYRFATANDFEDRDPVDWTLEGSADNATWTLLEVVTNYPVTRDRQVFTGNVPLAAQTPPVVTISADPVHLQAGETSTLTWSTTDAQTVSIAPAVAGGGDLNGTATVTPAAGITTWTLTAANTTAPVSKTTSVLVEGPAQQVTYKYFRFTQTALRNAPSVPNSIQISELELSLNGVPQTGATATNPGGNPPAAEGPANAADGDLTTKWLDFNRAPLVLAFPEPVAIDGYRIGTANDSMERDPVAWKLEGSADGTTWTVIDTRTSLAFAIPQTREVYTNYFRFAGTAPKVYVPVGLATYNKEAQSVSLTWDSEAGKTYLVERTTTLGAWQTAADNVASGGASTTQTLDTAGLETVFFRVSVKL